MTTQTYPLSLTVHLLSPEDPRLAQQYGIDLEAEMIAYATEEFVHADPQLNKHYVRGCIVGAIKKAQQSDPAVKSVTVKISSQRPLLEDLPPEFLMGYLQQMMDLQ